MTKRTNFTGVSGSMEHYPRLTFMRPTTLNIMFSVTYYMELCHAISMYYISHILSNKCQIGCLDII